MTTSISQIISQIMSWFQWWIVIAPWELAIRVRSGKTVNVLQPGIHFRIPGFDRFFVQGTRKRYINTPTQAVTTADKKTLTISGGTSYVIDDIGKLYSTLSDAEDVISIETMSLVSKYVSAHSSDEISPDSIESFVNEQLKLDRYGLGDVAFRVTDYVSVRTYRFITTNPKDYGNTVALNTNTEKTIGQ